jgi:hypothetical protein
VPTPGDGRRHHSTAPPSGRPALNDSLQSRWFHELSPAKPHHNPSSAQTPCGRDRWKRNTRGPVLRMPHPGPRCAHTEERPLPRPAATVSHYVTTLPLLNTEAALYVAPAQVGLHMRRLHRVVWGSYTLRSACRRVLAGTECSDGPQILAAARIRANDRALYGLYVHMDGRSSVRSVASTCRCRPQ